MHFVYFAHCSCSLSTPLPYMATPLCRYIYVYIHFRDRVAIFGLRGPNAELPSGGDNRLGQQQQEFTNLTLKFKVFFTTWYKTEQLNI